jgi:hypothetical protein
VDEANLVGVHEARVAHHVAAIRQVDSQHCAATILNRAGTVIVQLLVVVCVDVSSRKHLFDVGKKLRIDRHHVFEVAMSRTILHHPDLTITFDNLSFDLTDLLIDQNGYILFA